MEIDKIIFDHMLAYYRRRWRMAMKSNRPFMTVAEFKKFFRSQMEDDSVYKSFDVQNGKVRKSILALYSPNELAPNQIFCVHFDWDKELLTKKNLEAEFKAMRDFFKKQKSDICVRMIIDDVDCERVLTRLGFKNHGNMLAGGVEDALRFLKEKAFVGGYKIEYVKRLKDVESIQRMQLRGTQKGANEYC